MAFIDLDSGRYIIPDFFWFSKIRSSETQKQVKDLNKFNKITKK